MSLRSSASSIGWAAGPVVFARLMVGSGYRLLLLLAGVGALVFGFVLLVLARR